jgi:hypothetical protein
MRSRPRRQLLGWAATKIVLRSIGHDDVVRLEGATRGLGPLAVLARPILRFERRMLRDA